MKRTERESEKGVWGERNVRNVKNRRGNIEGYRRMGREERERERRKGWEREIEEEV